MPAYDKDQTLTLEMAKAGFSIQDLLEGSEVTCEQVGSSLVEKRQLQIPDLEFLIPQTENTVSGIVSIEQTKSTYLHNFVVSVFFPVGENSIAQVHFTWGVDSPESQRVNAMVQDFNEEGLAVASRSGQDEGFSPWDNQFISAILNGALEHKGINNG